MANVIESGIGSINYGRQTAKGTIAAAATTTAGFARAKLFDGVLSPKKVHGREEFLDGNRFASPSVFTDTVGGAIGDLTVQTQPENCILWPSQLLGIDTVTGAADPWTHTTTTAGTAGAWGTWWQAVGSAVGPEKGAYYDSKIAKWVRQVGSGQKVMHDQMSIMCLKPAQTYTTAPAKTEDTSDPYYWSESTGALTFDGTVLTDVDEEIIEVDTGMEPHQGNSITYGNLVDKKGSVTSSVKTLVTDDSLGKFRKAVYGTATPATGAEPVKDVFYAAISTVYTRSATRTLTHTRPRVEIDPSEMAIGGLREGGMIPISFGGACLKSGASPALSIVGLTGDSASYV